MARAAYLYVNIKTDVPFNLRSFNQECRKLLYNTERQTKRREAADNGSVSKSSSRPSCSSRFRHPYSVRDDSLTDDAEDFFNFKRSKTTGGGDADNKMSVAEKTEEQKPADKQSVSGKEVSNNDDEESSTEAEQEVVEPGSSQQTVNIKLKSKSPLKAVKGTESAEDPPITKRSQIPVASVYDHVRSVIEDGMDPDNLIKLLRGYAKALGQKKGYIKACKDVKMLADDLRDSNGNDDIMEMVENYNIALSKLPAIFE